MFSNTSSRVAMAVLFVVGFSACDGRRASDSLEEATFIVETISANMKGEIQEDEAAAAGSLTMGSSNSRRKLYQFSACLLDAVSHAPIVRTRFGVSDGITDREIVSDNSGCLLWEEKHRVSDINGADRLMRIKRTFKAIEGFSGSVTLELGFNPLEGELLDIRRLKVLPENLEQTSQLLTFESDIQAALSSSSTLLSFAQAFIPDIGLQFIEHDKSISEITPLMTLKTAQRFRLKFNPIVLRRNNKNEVVQVGLKGGNFNLWLVITKKDPVRSNITAEDIVAEFQGPVSVRYDSAVIHDIALRVHDTAGVLSRNHVLVALEPQGTLTTQARSGFFTGFISPLKGNDAGIAVLPVSNEQATRLAQKIDSALTNARSSGMGTLQALEKFSGLKPETNSSEKLLTVSKANTSSKEVKDLLKEYCAILYSSDLIINVPHTGYFAEVINFFDPDNQKKVHVLKACQKNPEDYVRLDVRDMVEKVNGAPKHVPNSTVVKDISVGRAVSFSHTQSQSSTASASGGAGISGEAGIGWSTPDLAKRLGGAPSAGLGFKISGGADWNVAVAKNKSSSTGVSTSVSEGHQFNVVSDTYQIDATVRRCAIVSATVEGGKKGFFSCAAGTDRRRLEETYYLVNHGIASSPFSDEDSADNTRWRLTIRGTEMYKQFEETMTKGNTVLEFSKLTLTVDGKSRLLPDFRVTQEFPGAVLPQQ